MYSTSYLLFQSLTAVALGDALGFPIQHDTRSNPFDEPVHEMVGHQTQEVPAGTWSDDTSLSIASLVSLTFGYNLHDLMTRYSQWYTLGTIHPSTIHTISMKPPKPHFNVSTAVLNRNCVVGRWIQIITILPSNG